ncbi:uncharacterized protein LOC133172634 [Saccostrea echinata]|uniref:uncharacterized protein LOC133172634 n=1 Tax=Saccostrea echinata TaxID=191078 RepID=UPI002A81E625|nr:uncharacterized protein LOC133172634 [Saccostrea echinata]
MDSSRFINPPFDEMDAEAKSKYIGDEIMNYFRPSRENGPEGALVVIVLTILANIFLFVAILATGNIKKSSSLLEFARGLSEVLLLVSVALQSTRNIYNTTETSKAVSGFVAFWLFSMGSVCFGLMKAFTGFLHFTGKSSFSNLIWLIILVVFAISTFLAFIVLCVMYVANVLAFVVLACMFYYLPFMGMWVLDGVRILHLRNHSTKNVVEMETLTRDKPGTSELKQSEGEVQFLKPMTNFEMFIVILYGLCHTVAFAMVTMIITRIAWVFFRPVSTEIRLESVPGIL